MSTPDQQTYPFPMHPTDVEHFSQGSFWVHPGEAYHVSDYAPADPAEATGYAVRVTGSVDIDFASVDVAQGKDN
ncbi:MAG: hypothetical protein JWM37_370 [Candidatus Saccharibacteria bacterium]|nr:hypothetical protein [Candidatus Saccharibacteria bacterium]